MSSIRRLLPHLSSYMKQRRTLYSAIIKPPSLRTYLHRDRTCRGHRYFRDTCNGIAPAPAVRFAPSRRYGRVHAAFRHPRHLLSSGGAPEHMHPTIARRRLPSPSERNYPGLVRHRSLHRNVPGHPPAARHHARRLRRPATAPPVSPIDRAPMRPSRGQVRGEPPRLPRRRRPVDRARPRASRQQGARALRVGHVPERERRRRVPHQHAAPLPRRRAPGAPRAAPGGTPQSRVRGAAEDLRTRGPATREGASGDCGQGAEFRVRRQQGDGHAGPPGRGRHAADVR